MSRTDSERLRAERAAARRTAAYPGQVVKAGAPKPVLYTGLSPLERLDRMTALCHAQWVTAGRPIERTPRSAMPGEIFQLAHD